MTPVTVATKYETVQSCCCPRTVRALSLLPPLRLFRLRQRYASALWSQSPTAKPFRVTWLRGRSPGADPERREGLTRRGKGRLGGGGAAQVPGIPYREALWRPSLQPTGHRPWASAAPSCEGFGWRSLRKARILFPGSCASSNPVIPPRGARDLPR